MLITIAVLPAIPPAIAVNVIATVWIVAAVAIFRLIEDRNRTTAASGYGGIAISGLGIAVLGMGAEAFRLGHPHWGLATVFDGFTLLAVGAAVASRDRQLIGAAMIDWGLAIFWIGLVTILDNNQWHGLYGKLTGVPLAAFGMAVAAVGVTLIAENRRFLRHSVIAAGVTLVVWGIVLLVFGMQIGVAASGFGIGASGIGVAVIVAGYGWSASKANLVGYAGTAAGVSLVLYGVASGLDGGLAFGLAVAGLGTAATLASIVYTRRISRSETAASKQNSRVKLQRHRLRSPRHASLVRRTTRGRERTR
ncbi:hypothetical protein [Nocardia sp. XZ_19_369]|uniref:hypothetical protein n=1 Tax=Nocardia sp. XZ_19_369 TaxID=2769487 RepID=UPI0018901E74|nr:hypothetical protein [Nocardia sp. XZ_19_369]